MNALADYTMQQSAAGNANSGRTCDMSRQHRVHGLLCVLTASGLAANYPWSDQIYEPPYNFETFSNSTFQMLVRKSAHNGTLSYTTFVKNSEMFKTARDSGKGTIDLPTFQSVMKSRLQQIDLRTMLGWPSQQPLSTSTYESLNELLYLTADLYISHEQYVHLNEMIDKESKNLVWADVNAMIEVLNAPVKNGTENSNSTAETTTAPDTGANPDETPVKPDG